MATMMLTYKMEEMKKRYEKKLKKETDKRKLLEKHIADENASKPDEKKRIFARDSSDDDARNSGNSSNDDISDDNNERPALIKTNKRDNSSNDEIFTDDNIERSGKNKKKRHNLSLYDLVVEPKKKKAPTPVTAEEGEEQEEEDEKEDEKEEEKEEEREDERGEEPIQSTSTCKYTPSLLKSHEFEILFEKINSLEKSIQDIQSQYGYNLTNMNDKEEDKSGETKSGKQKKKDAKVASKSAFYCLKQYWIPEIKTLIQEMHEEIKGLKIDFTKLT